MLCDALIFGDCIDHSLRLRLDKIEILFGADEFEWLFFCFLINKHVCVVALLNLIESTNVTIVCHLV